MSYINKTNIAGETTIATFSFTKLGTYIQLEFFYSLSHILSYGSVVGADIGVTNNRRMERGLYLSRYLGDSFRSSKVLTLGIHRKEMELKIR